MRVRVHISCENNDKNRDYLKSNRIDFDCVGDDILVFDIFEDDALHLEVMRRVGGERLFEAAVYSEEEMNSAEWFLMRSKCGKIASADDAHTFMYSCPLKDGRSHHRAQVREYVVNKNIQWKSNNNFYSADVGDFQTIFCSGYARDRFLENGINGIGFASVLQKKTMLPKDDLFQMKFERTIPREALILPANASVIGCEQCGKEQILLPEPNNFVLGIDHAYLQSEIDAYITDDLFGDGFGYHLLIVSRKVYALIGEMRERNMVFTPVNVESF